VQSRCIQVTIVTAPGVFFGPCLLGPGAHEDAYHEDCCTRCLLW
jgi:hypothetical protein